MTISIRHKVIDWYKNKAERRAACRGGQHFTGFDRHNYRAHKQDVRKYIDDMTNPPGLWNISVKMQDDNRLDWIIYQKHGEEEYKNRIRRRTEHLRRIRLFQGTPFGPTDRPFYYDCWSKFVSPDENEKAEQDGVKFHKITMTMFAGRATTIVLLHESRRQHQGFWTLYHEDDDWPVDKPQPMTFGFESVADFALFRLTYEYPVVSMQQAAA